MAKKSMIVKEAKKKQLVIKYKKIRDELKSIILNPNLDDEIKFQASIKLQKLPRNSSPIRIRNRCMLTGRPHGYYRKFGLGRNKLRESVMRGDVPGVTKASW